MDGSVQEIDPARINSARKTMNSILFLSSDTMKLLDCSNTLGSSLFGRKWYERINRFTVDHYIALNIAWYASLPFAALEISQLYSFSLYWFGPLLIFGTVIVFLTSFNLILQTLVDNFRNFDTCFLFLNLIVNTCLLGSSFGSPGKAVFIFTLYFFSYYCVLIIDMKGPGFSYMNKTISKALADCQANTLVQNDSGQRGELISLSHLSITSTITHISSKTSDNSKKGKRWKKLNPVTRPYSNKFIFLSSLGILFGILLEFILLIAIYTNHIAIGSERLFSVGWEKWSIRDLLLYTSANILLFSCNRLYVVVSHPGSPICYRSGLIRVPLVPEWLHLVESFRSFEAKCNHSDNHKKSSTQDRIDIRGHSKPNFRSPSIIPNTSTSMPANFEDFQVESIAAEAPQENGWRTESLKTTFFHDQSVIIDTARIKQEKLAAVVCLEGKHVEYKKKEASLISKLILHGPRFVTTFRNFRRLKFACWFITYCMYPFASLGRYHFIDSIFIIFCSVAILDMVLFLLNVPSVIYKNTLRSFETMFILGNSFALVAGLMDYFRWQGARVYLGLTGILLTFFQTMFYDVMFVNWKSVSRHIKEIQIGDEFEQSMPFTASLLRRLDRYYVEIGMIGVQSPQQIKQHRKLLKLNSNNHILRSDEMSAKERRFYRKLIGVRSIIYYFGLLFFVTVMYFLVVSGVIENTEERVVRLLFLEWSNLSIFKGAALNLVIFASKRMYSNWRNPMLSTSLTVTKQMVPLVSSLLSVIGQLQSSGGGGRIEREAIDGGDSDSLGLDDNQTGKGVVMDQTICFGTTRDTIPFVVPNPIRITSPFQRDSLKSESKIFESNLHGIVPGEVEVQELDDDLAGVNAHQRGE